MRSVVWPVAATSWLRRWLPHAVVIRANGLAVKMNHGAGPLPVHSETGTFMRVKRSMLQRRTDDDHLAS